MEKWRETYDDGPKITEENRRKFGEYVSSLTNREDSVLEDTFVISDIAQPEGNRFMSENNPAPTQDNEQ